MLQGYLQECDKVMIEECLSNLRSLHIEFVCADLETSQTCIYLEGAINALNLCLNS